jgi:hypothetical protein
VVRLLVGLLALVAATIATPVGASAASAAAAPAPRPALCPSLEGQLTDDAGRGVAGVQVRLALRGETQALEVATDENGGFHFGGLPDTDAARAPDAATLSVLVQDGSGVWRVHAGAAEAALVSRSFALTEEAGCTRDLPTRDLTGYASANPAQPAQWADLWAVVRKTQRAFAFMSADLSEGLRDLPVVIYAWCPPLLDAKRCGADSTSAFSYDRSTSAADRRIGIGATGRVGYVALGARRADEQSEHPDDDTLFHEFGHILLADLAGGFAPLTAPGQRSHAGYANPSSNDSWVEGFASWFAVAVRLSDGRAAGYYEWANGARQSLERPVRAWDANGADEEWAVASLLHDLVDRSAPGAEVGQEVATKVTSAGSHTVVTGTARGARSPGDAVVVRLYDAAGEVVGSTSAHLFDDGRFVALAPTGSATARAHVRPLSAVSASDDDPFALQASDVLDVITSAADLPGRAARARSSQVAFDVAELHSALRSLPGRADDVDALFRTHGFHDDRESARRFVPGARIGTTAHPPFGVRYSTEILPARRVRIDTGGIAATVVVFPEGGTPYEAVADAAGTVPVLVPGDVSSHAAVVTLAAGRAPAVTVIGAGDLWAQASRQPGASFLTITPQLQPESASGAPAPLRRSVTVWLLVGAVLVLLVTTAAGAAALAQRRRHSAAVVS